ncbi:hypothetical protein OUZ56_013900 [Daphnia magna]|uniref:THAP-type domain-containing protein n=1 Tax=Daphnia magna TaxID=35525 RepID=A0ABQ9Z7Z0_9CRUS|nr:hypothetical protein OUZ56_013900 [Daphnia magna]
MRRVCCICGEFETQSRKSSFSFFSIPKKHGLLRANEIQLVERRISAWNAILGQYLNRHYGIQCVCSNHFHSGKPSYLYLDNDVDCVPSKNLSNLQQHEESGIENVADCSLQSDMSMNDCVMNSTSVSNENTAPDNLLNCNLSINANSLGENLLSEEENSMFCYYQFQVLVN